MADDSRYAKLIVAIFRKHYRKGATSFEFVREEIEAAAREFSIRLPKNLGDVIYSVRYRTDLPEEIAATAPEDKEWRIEPAGTAKYRFRLGRLNKVVPDPAIKAIKLPDATPEIVRARALDDEQALLAIVRYNRMVDIFLGIAAYSLQNHLRTSVKGMGQIEVDELYVGVDKKGVQYVVPVQAKGGTDRISVIQASQDIAFCKERYPDLVCRTVSAQFMDEQRVAMFELELDDDGEISIVEQRHYKLVQSDAISPDELSKYRRAKP
jgi:hypothetical protein